jgi:hypothetical protein
MNMEQALTHPNGSSHFLAGFNREHYRKVWEAKAIPTKDGWYDTFTFANGRYCPPLGKWLGLNGRIEGTEFQGKIAYHTHNSLLQYELETISVHWHHGYYYTAVMRKLDTQSNCFKFIQNINCVDSTVLEGIAEFQKNYILIT